MNENGQDKVIAFDLLFTNKRIQMLKIFMPYFDRSMQKNLAIHIKYLELQYTMDFFKKYPSASLDELPHESSFNISNVFGDILPYCEDKEKTKLESMRNMFQTFANFKEMMEMMQMMKELFPEGENPMDSMDTMASMASMGGLDPDMLSGMAGMFGSSGFDPSQMFEMFQAMSGTGGESNGNQQTEPSGMDGG